jgi:hypothetical protein
VVVCQGYTHRFYQHDVAVAVSLIYHCFSLPPNVLLLHLHDNSNFGAAGSLLIRLAHSYQVGRVRLAHSYRVQSLSYKA